METAFLALDVGNTSIGVGYFTARRLARRFCMASDAGRSEDEYGIALKAFAAEAALAAAGPMPSILASVVPALTGTLSAALETYFGFPPIIIEPPYDRFGVEVRYDNVAEVGPDRVVNALAVTAFYGAPAIAVDFGTATTFDVVAGDGAYVGGVISPGVEVSAGTLFARAARLGAVDFRMPEKVVGRNTDEALRAGIILGAARAADGIVAAIRAETGEAGALVATGGLAPIIAPVMTTAPVVDPDLTLKGLALARARWLERARG